MKILNQGIIAKTSPFFHADYVSASGGSRLGGTYSDFVLTNLVDFFIPFIIIAGFIVGWIILYNYVLKDRK